MLNLVFNDDLDKDVEWNFIPAVFVSADCTSIPNAKVVNYFKTGIRE